MSDFVGCNLGAPKFFLNLHFWVVFFFPKATNYSYVIYLEYNLKQINFITLRLKQSILIIVCRNIVQ